MTQPDEREATVRAYVAALCDGDLVGMLALFRPDAEVVSPLRGHMDAETFYRELFEDTRSSVVRILDVLTGATGTTAAAELEYDWTLKDGGRVRFPCVDVFRFDAQGQIQELRIFYDARDVRPVYAAVRNS